MENMNNCISSKIESEQMKDVVFFSDWEVYVFSIDATCFSPYEVSVFLAFHNVAAASSSDQFKLVRLMQSHSRKLT